MSVHILRHVYAQCISELDQFNLFLPAVFRRTLGTLRDAGLFPKRDAGFFSQSDCRYYLGIRAAISLVAKNFKIANFYRKL